MRIRKGDLVIKIKSSGPNDEYVGKIHLIVGYSKTMRGWLNFLEPTESAVEFYKETGGSVTALPPEYFKLLTVTLSDVTYL